jgi:hypothetical protein
MATQLTLYNNALLLLGERPLASLTENREARRLLDTVWARPVVRECLERGQWRFAMRTVELSYSPSVEPPFGYTYAFDKPEDLIRTTAVCQDEYLRVPLLEYQVEGIYWYANLDTIYVRYVSDDTSFGGDLSSWPANFTRFVEATMADAICERITQNKEDWKAVRFKLKDALTIAKSTDAMEEATQFLPAGSWTRARRGDERGDRGNKSRLIG